MGGEIKVKYTPAKKKKITRGESILLKQSHFAATDSFLVLLSLSYLLFLFPEVGILRSHAPSRDVQMLPCSDQFRFVTIQASPRSLLPPALRAGSALAPLQAPGWHGDAAATSPTAPWR